ncbi:MAG: alpha/beta hydrolase [Micrococcales bacterium]|nr:alpha/beta hydrolase [Micrococcales bacterium]
MTTKNSPTVILVPGYWLGGWAWDHVTDALQRQGVKTQAVTLPGLENLQTPRYGIGLEDHVAAINKVIGDVSCPVVLVAHSGAGALASLVLDRAPDLVGRVVYVDSGPVADGSIARPDLAADAVELPLPSWEQLEAGGASLTGLDEAALQRFRTGAVPHPAGPLRQPARLDNPGRLQVPATVICCSMPSAVIRQMLADGGGMFASLADYQDLSYVDLPTGHWPMWSAPDALAKAIAAAEGGTA